LGHFNFTTNESGPDTLKAMNLSGLIFLPYNSINLDLFRLAFNSSGFQRFEMKIAFSLSIGIRTDQDIAFFAQAA